MVYIKFFVDRNLSIKNLLNLTQWGVKILLQMKSSIISGTSRGTGLIFSENTLWTCLVVLAVFRLSGLSYKFYSSKNTESSKITLPVILLNQSFMNFFMIYLKLLDLLPLFIKKILFNAGRANFWYSRVYPLIKSHI